MSLLSKRQDRAMAARDKLNSMGMDGDLFMRLSGFYAMGPIMPDGLPEFGYRDFTGRDERAGITVEAQELVHQLLDRMTPAVVDSMQEAIETLSKLTFAIQHNPNCPSPWLIRVPGKSAIIDMKPYSSVTHSDDLTGDRLAFGKTLPDAVAKLALPEEPAPPAPDLLEAAKAVEAWWVSEGQHISHGAPVGMFMLRQAISKAEQFGAK